MPPVTRKRNAPLSPLSLQTSSSSEDEFSVINVASTSTDQYKFKCPVNGCRKTFKIVAHLRRHHRTHTKVKPYKCAFPSCNQTYFEESHLINHICNVHRQQNRKKAKKYVKVQRKVLAEEAKQLNIKEHLTSVVYNGENDNDAVANLPTLPHFTTIHRTSTGHFICPLNECDHKSSSISKLKSHYRVHGGINYRPFLCKFPDSCRYATTARGAVEDHIRNVHISRNNTDINAYEFVEGRTDWLEKEDDLFNNAEIISAPEIQIPRSYECTFTNCTKKFSEFRTLFNHRRTHTQSKPFKCLFPNCRQTSAVKGHIRRHILQIHFNVRREDIKNISKEENQRAKQYVHINQDVVDNEEQEIAMFRKKKKQKMRNSSSSNLTLSGQESPDFTKVQFEDDEDDDEDDDKDELTALLTTVQSTSSD